MDTTRTFTASGSRPRRSQPILRCEHGRSPDPAFHFEVLLPSDWRPVDLPAEAPRLGQPARLALFRSLDKHSTRAELDVTAFLLPREVAPADWLDLFLARIGQETIERTTSPSPGGEVATVVTRGWGVRGWVISRWTTVKDFNRLFVLHACCYESYHHKHASAFDMLLTSFQLLHPSGWPLAERLLSFSRRYPGDFCLFYPESWQLAMDPDSHENARGVDIFNRQGEAVRGRIRLAAIAQACLDDPQPLVESLIADLRVHGGEVACPHLVPSAAVGGFEETWRGHTAVTIGPDVLKVQLTAGQRPDAWFMITLFTPSRATDAEAWGINQRAYDLMLERFRTPTEAPVQEGVERETHEAFSCEHITS